MIDGSVSEQNKAFFCLPACMHESAVESAQLAYSASNEGTASTNKLCENGFSVQDRHEEIVKSA